MNSCTSSDFSPSSPSSPPGPPNEDCDVTCVGLTFTASGQEGQDVCTAAQCGSGAPYVGLSTFGCSGDVNSWNGNCCNVNLCDSSAAPGPPASPPGPPDDNCDVTMDLAIGSVATASSGDGSLAVDGMDSSRWESDFAEPEWLMLDLGEEVVLCSAEILWEGAYSRSFEIQTSLTGGITDEEWTTVLVVTGQSIDVSTAAYYSFTAAETETSAQFVRFTGTERATQWGHSFWRLSLYGPQQPAAGRRRMEDDTAIAPASSLEPDESLRARGACSAWPDEPNPECSDAPMLQVPACPELCDGGCDNGYCDCGHAQCVCMSGYSGPDCSVDICASSRCGVHGECTARYLGSLLPTVAASCECEHPWVGPTCEENPCADVQCGRETAFFAPLDGKTRTFVETGSGQS